MKAAVFALWLVAQGSSTLVPIPCVGRDSGEETLRGKYGEEVVDWGVTTGSALVQLWESEEGSWTLVLQMRNGQICFLSAGEDWTRGGEVERDGI